MNNAVGMLEVYGLVTAFAAADAACKAAEVTIEAFDRNRPADPNAQIPLIIMIKIRGSVAAVEAALDAGEKAANKQGGVILRHIIPRPEQDTEKMLKISAI